MHDRQLHYLDRQARQGDTYAAQKRLVERLRRGQLNQERLVLAAYLGDPGAALFLNGTAPSPPDPASDASVIRYEVVLPARQVAASLSGVGTVLPRDALRPQELLENLDRLDPDCPTDRRRILGWVDAFWSGLGLPRASDLIRLGLWFRHLPRCDASVHTRAGLAVLLRGWEVWSPETLARHEPRLVAAVAAVARWALDPSGGRANLSGAVLDALPSPRELASGCESVLAMSYRLLPSTFDDRRGSRPLELIAWRGIDALCPIEREPRVSLGADTPLSHACWTRLIAGRDERQAAQHAVRALLLPWAVGETDPLADWLCGRPLPLAWAPPPPKALKSTA